MLVFFQFILLFVSLYVLAKFADFALQNLLKVAHILKWGTFFVAFIILGAATSSPELFVGINSALDKTPQLSLGNVMGATIVLLTLIIGITATISGRVKIDAWFSKTDLVLMNIVLLLPILLLYDGLLSRIDAALIMASYAFYIGKIYRDRHKITPTEPEKIKDKSKLNSAIFFFVLGFAGIAISANFAVDRAIEIATALNIPILLIGIVVFSIGTNFPELVIAITALRKKEKNLVAGNILGSTTANSLVLAVVTFIHPIEVQDFRVFAVSAFFYVGAVLIFSFFVSSKNDISRLEGFILLSFYSFFIIAEVITKLV